jgi:hypothetical protein
LIAGVCVLAGVLAIRLGVLTGAGPSKAKQEAGLAGYWDVTGVMLQAHNDAAQTPGEMLHRLCRIDKTCASQTCTLRLTRQVAGSTSQTIGGTLSAQLHWSAGRWLATFIQPYVVCDGDTRGEGGVEISTWTIKLARSGTITALEQTDTQGASCVPATSEIEWNAHRLAAPQSSAAQRSAPVAARRLTGAGCSRAPATPRAARARGGGLR